MTLRSDSYGSVDEVRALTRHLLDGAPTFTPLTRPTYVEVEGMIDRWSAVLNVALAARGVPVPVTDAVAALVCDQWVIRQAATEVELTQRGTGWNADEGSRIQALRMGEVNALADTLAQSLAQTGDAPGQSHEGLTYTGLQPASDRADTGNSAYEQPLFTRRQFDL